MSAYDNIFEAAKAGTVDDVRYFVEKKGIYVNAINYLRITPLHFACGWNFDANVVLYLVSRGADVNAKNEDGGTPVYYAASTNSAAVLQILISHGAIVNTKLSGRDFRGWTPLHRAADTNSDIEVLKCLILHGADVNAKTIGFFGLWGKTPLDVANTDEKKLILREAMARR